MMRVCGSEASYLHGHKAGCYRKRIAIGVCVFEDSNTHARTRAHTHANMHNTCIVNGLNKCDVALGGLITCHIVEVTFT